MSSSAGPRLHRDAGMSLVEVMVAMALFVMGSLSLLVVLTSSTSGSFDNRSRLTSASLAASDIDEARSLPYTSLTTTTTTKTVDGRQYRIVREVRPTFASATESTTCLGGGSSRQLHKRVSTRVEPVLGWRGRAQTPVRSDTIVRAPVFDPSKADGAIGVVVLDRAGAALSGMSLQVSSTTRATDGRGCVYFEGLPEGTYTVNVTTSGWVTVAGTTSITMTVRKGQISSGTMRIGRTARITVATHIHDGTGVVSNPGAWAWPTDKLTARLASPDRATPTRFESAPKPLSLPSTEVSWDSYPQPAGYEAFLNPCSVPVRTASEPTTSPRVVLPLRPVKVHLTISGSSETKARNRTVVVQRATGVDCGDPPVYATSATTTSSNCVHDCIVSIALPGGTWRFTALSTGPGVAEKSVQQTVSGSGATVSIDVS